LIPTYGNWGGPGWSSGAYTDNKEEVNWNVPPVDAMDQAFKEHDRMYQLGYPELGDVNLLIALTEINTKGVYAYAYRVGAFIVFGSKVVISLWRSIWEQVKS